VRVTAILYIGIGTRGNFVVARASGDWLAVPPPATVIFAGPPSETEERSAARRCAADSLVDSSSFACEHFPDPRSRELTRRNARAVDRRYRSSGLTSGHLVPDLNERLMIGQVRVEPLLLLRPGPGLNFSHFPGHQFLLSQFQRQVGCSFGLPPLSFNKYLPEACSVKLKDLERV